MGETTSRPEETVAGITELVRTWEPDEDPWATVVLVHGLAEHSGRHAATADRLRRAGMRVRGFDLVGHGRSGGRPGDVEDWSVFLDQLERHVGAARSGGAPVVLLGHSMGGLIAVEYCLAERPPVDLLVLSAPSLAGGSRGQRILASGGSRILPGLRLPTGITGRELSRDGSVAAAYRNDPLVHRRVTIRLGAQLFAAMDRTEAQVGHLSVPTLVLRGEADPIVPAAATRTLRTLPCADHRVLPALRHECFNEPEGPEVVEEVVSWVRDTLPGTASSAGGGSPGG